MRQRETAQRVRVAARPHLSPVRAAGAAAGVNLAHAALLKIAEHPDLFRQVMAAGSERTSVQHIWRQEMQSRICRHVTTDPPAPTSPAEVAESAPEETETAESPSELERTAVTTNRPRRSPRAPRRPA